MEQWPGQRCGVVYSDCIIHQATGLGLEWVPRVHRCLMAWQVVSRLLGPPPKRRWLLDGNTILPQDTQRTQHSEQLVMPAEASGASGWLKEVGELNDTTVHSLKMTTCPGDGTICILDEGNTTFGCEGRLIVHIILCDSICQMTGWWWLDVLQVFTGAHVFVF